MNKNCISGYIRQARNKKGIKYKWLAEEIGVTQASLSYKLDKNRLYATEFIKLAIVLDLDIAKIVEEIKKEGENECISKD